MKSSDTATVDPGVPVSVIVNSPGIVLASVTVLVPKLRNHCAVSPVPGQV